MWYGNLRVCAVEHYKKVGWLDFLAVKWKEEDRERAAFLWAKDFQEMGGSLTVIDMTKERVDCGGFKQPSEERAKAEDRFRKATRVIPRDFFEVCAKICLENKMFKGSQPEAFAIKKDLVRGLDYLCDFYANRAFQHSGKPTPRG